MTEKYFLEQLKASNEQALESLYNQYFNKIYKVSLRFGLNHEDAVEIVQDVFIKVWERRKEINLDLSFNAYLLTICKNLIIKKARKNTTKIAFQKYYSKFQDGIDHSTEDLIVFADLLKITEGFVDMLPPQQKEIFRLSRIEQLSHQEISNRLNISIRTVENHVYRASEKLKLKLKELGVTISILLCLSL